MAASSRFATSACLTLALVLALVTGNAAQNQNEVSVGFHAFQDSRGVTVLSPDVGLTRDLTDKTAVRVKFGVDAISAASDSCARCHQDGAENSRVVGGLSLTRKRNDTKITVGAELSKELFYSATTALASVSRDLNKANTNVSAGVSYSLNRPVLHPGDTTESQRALDGFVSLTQSWTRTTVTQVGYQIDQVNGYQSNPFLRTRVNGILRVGEAPDARTRHAVSARLRQALGTHTFVDADYRRYHDTWEIDSDALSVGLSQHAGERVVLGASYRRYAQTGAYFYAPQYTGTPQFFTGDFRLFPFTSGLYTGRLQLTPANGLLGMPAGTSLTLQYERYNATTGFQAAIFSGSIRLPLGGGAPPD